MRQRGRVMMHQIILLCSLLGAVAAERKHTSTAAVRSRRESAGDYWTRVLGGEGLDLRTASHVNSWPDLFHQIQDEGDERSHLIEGDVFLHWASGSGKAEPTMLIPPNRAHALTFRQWITRAPDAGRAIKVNLLSTDAVRPTLQYVFAHKQRVSGPLVVHADVLPGPGSTVEAVSLAVLAREAADLAPNATLGVGWTPTSAEALTSMDPSKLRYSWREVLDMVSAVQEVNQPVLFSVSASLAAASFHQLLFLLGVRPNWSLFIRTSPLLAEGERERIPNWAALIGLREQLPRERILYDVQDDVRGHLREALPGGMRSVYVEPSPWRRQAWRVVQFINPRRVVSTIVLSERGAAFLGWPTAFLLSEKTPSPAHVAQSVSGRVLFVPKPALRRVNRERGTGLTVFLFDSVLDVGSPRLEGAAAAALFIGLDGRIRITGSQPRPRKRRRGWRRTERRIRVADVGASGMGGPVSRAFVPTAESQMPLSLCYAFAIQDQAEEVSLSVWASSCSGSPSEPPAKSWRRTLSLRLPRNPLGRQRHVLVQKTGDGTLDLVLQRLEHSSARRLGTSGAWTVGGLVASLLLCHVL